MYRKEITDILNDEQEKRNEFYMKMKEDEKVEFISGEIVYQSPAKFEHIRVISLS